MGATIVATETHREEVLNVLLAQLLHERGIASAPEQILQTTARQRRMPDVIVTFHGLRTVVEGKVDDHPGAAKEVRANAAQRVEEGVSHLAVALLYPKELRKTPFKDLKRGLEVAPLRIAVFSESGDTGWVEGNLEHLSQLLRRTYEQLVEEDVVARAVEVLSQAVEGFARAVLPEPGSVERAAQALGMAGETTGDATPKRRRRRG
ncbi:MAG: hypothetical protein IH865_01620 [Chloroflexi bacterium]|nr:hypothetical protein [Chloroflexota bacterium]